MDPTQQQVAPTLKRMNSSSSTTSNSSRSAKRPKLAKSNTIPVPARNTKRVTTPSSTSSNVPSLPSNPRPVRGGAPSSVTASNSNRRGSGRRSRQQSISMPDSTSTGSAIFTTPPPLTPVSPTTPREYYTSVPPTPREEYDWHVQAQMQGRSKEELKALLDNFSEEQLQRYEVFRRSALNRANVKRLVSQVLNQPCSQTLGFVVAGFTKVFVGEIIELARRVQSELGESGPLTPEHLREAHRRYKKEAGHTNALDDVTETIPRDYPPKLYQYIDGIKHFIIRRRDNGYPVTVVDGKRVRDELCRDPVGWENECTDANLAIDRWMTNERGENGNFWLFYLPLLSRWEYGHERVDYGDHAIYELCDREGRLWFECDMQECIDHWSNVRIDQWSTDAQRHVAEFLYHAQQPKGWEPITGLIGEEERSPTNPHGQFNQDDSKEPLVLIECGSFSPVTNQHLRMFEMAKDDIGHYTNYEVIGGYFSPVSDHYDKKGLAPAHHRVRMCELAVETTSTWLMVDSWESLQSNYSTTVRVLDHFDKELNEKNNGVVTKDGVRRRVKIMLLAGADLIESFSVPGLWADDDLRRILGVYGCVIIERTGTDIWKAVVAHDILYEHRKNICIVKRLIQTDESSTKLRLLIKRKLSIKYLLPCSVIEYIQAHDLYK
ncbi:5113_t:CDS:10 [Paraglomus occultum]|uniref:Transcription initiation factor TFIID subunit 11 n=1 Tax=Paraglomus occultum TaxID=144539 RepID=A0A9N9AME7_9GLOM|nr:5113_t:CDS:10 [Paraglomus occultum]